MKHLIILCTFIFFSTYESKAQKVYYTDTETDADLVVYEVDEKTDADIVIKEIDSESDVRKGFWKEVETSNEADITVYISDTKTTDILKIFFTEYNDEVWFETDLFDS